MKRWISRIIIMIIVSFTALLFTLDIKIIASDLEYINGENLQYELSCKNVVVKTDGTTAIDRETLKDSIVNACELKGQLKDNLIVTIPEIDKAGVYPCEVKLKDTDVIVNVSVTVVNKTIVTNSPSPTPIVNETIDKTTVNQESYTDGVIVDGKKYEVLVRTSSKLFGEKVIFSDGINEYIGYFDLGFYLNAKPNFTFFIVTISFMIVSLVYVLIQNRNQKEYLSYKGEK